MEDTYRDICKADPCHDYRQIDADEIDTCLWYPEVKSQISSVLQPEDWCI